MTYLDYLPAIYQEGADPDQLAFFNAYLLGFEQVLTGVGNASDPGLEEFLDGISGPAGPVLGGLARYFIPMAAAELLQTDRHFLPWLSGWVALVLRQDATEAQQRRLIANAVSVFYRLRGTAEGIRQVLAAYDIGVQIDEDLERMQIGVNSTIGVDTRIDGGAPNEFRVNAYLPVADPSQLAALTQRITAIVDIEKPAHTFYELTIDTPVLQIGVTSTIGVDTMLGTPPA
ncbi:MAG TPA: phage tail protein [Solirubrobacteraceae bacterium]|nr:phage tail protein [Solirubrobacteraceae bacterium]